MSSPLGVYFLDVGQGDCSFIVPPAGGAVLFDCNDAYVAERFVADHGINHLAAAVVSHLDVDHIRGVLPFLEGFLARGGKVDEVYLGMDAKPEERLNETCTALLDRAIAWERAEARALLTHPRVEAQDRLQRRRLERGRGAPVLWGPAQSDSERGTAE